MKSRVSAFSMGFFVTAIMQSSTATTLVTASFLRKSMIGLTAGIAIVLGSDLSTTIVAQILIFDLSWLSPALIVIGFLIARQSSKSRKNTAIANIFISIGLTLLALSLIREVSADIKESELVLKILTALSSDVFLAIAFSAVLTILMQSSLATILFYAALASQGLIALDFALLLVFGANIGGAFIAYILTKNDGIEARRLTLSNILIRTSCTVLLIPFIPQIENLLGNFNFEMDRIVTIAHTGYNLVAVIIFFPITQSLSVLITKLIKDGKASNGQRVSNYLDEQALEKPAVALAGATRETLRMTEMVEDMAIQAFDAMKTNDVDMLEKTAQMDNELDQLYKEIKIFLSRLHAENLSEAEARQHEKIIMFATNLEHCGDVVEHSLTDIIKKKIDKKENFSDEGWKEIKKFHEMLIENIKTAQSILLSGSVALADEMLEHKRRLKDIEHESRRKHFARLSKGDRQSQVTSSIHLDFMRDLGRINSYITAIAYETVNEAETLKRL